MTLPLAMRGSEPHLDLLGVALAVSPEGAVFDGASGTLIVADLHLEKGSAGAVRGLFLPPYDTAATLAALTRVVARFAPRTVVCLGDSFHDDGGPRRLSDDDRARIGALARGRTWVWIAGNHDPSRPDGLPGEHADEMRLGPLTLRHEPRADAADGEIAGHLHPVAVVRGEAASVRRRCVAADRRRAVLPAFGAYAGGLSVRDPALRSLFDRKTFLAFVLGTDRVYPVAASRCL